MPAPGKDESPCRTNTEPHPLSRKRSRPRSTTERLARLHTWKRLTEAGWQQTGPAIADAADEIFRRAMDAGGAFIAVKGEIASTAKVSISTIDNARRLMEAHGLLIVRRHRLSPTRSRPNAWVLTRRGRAIADAALGIQRVTPTLCKKDISNNPTETLPPAHSRGRAGTERGVHRADGATPRKHDERSEERRRPASNAQRALEGSSALGRVPHPTGGHSPALTETIRRIATEILEVDPGDIANLPEAIRSRFLPGLSPDAVARTIRARGQPAFEALVYAAALTKTRTTKPIRSPAGLFLKVAWHTGQSPSGQLEEILSARRRLAAPVQGAPLSSSRPSHHDRAKAEDWISSLPPSERSVLQARYRVTGNPYDRPADWMIRAWEAAGRPEVSQDSQAGRSMDRDRAEGRGDRGAAS